MHLRPPDCQFIIDEIMACNGFVELAGASEQGRDARKNRRAMTMNLFQAARHKYGCRIIQRTRCLASSLCRSCGGCQAARTLFYSSGSALLICALPLCFSAAKVSESEVECVATAILSDVSGIARHPYGNYAAASDDPSMKVLFLFLVRRGHRVLCARLQVLQNLLEHGTPAHRHKLAEAGFESFVQLSLWMLLWPYRSSERRSCPFARIPSGVQWLLQHCLALQWRSASLGSILCGFAARVQVPAL